MLLYFPNIRLIKDTAISSHWNFHGPRRCKISLWTTIARATGQCAPQLLLYIFGVAWEMSPKNVLKPTDQMWSNGAVRVKAGVLHWFWLHFGEACADGWICLRFRPFAVSCLRFRVDGLTFILGASKIHRMFLSHERLHCASIMLVLQHVASASQVASGTWSSWALCGVGCITALSNFLDWDTTEGERWWSILPGCSVANSNAQRLCF